MNATILVLQLWFFGLPNSQPLGGPFVSASECVEQVQRYNDPQPKCRLVIIDPPPSYTCTYLMEADGLYHQICDNGQGAIEAMKCDKSLLPAGCYQETVPVQFDPSRLRDATKENRK